ncbi:Hypothetical predicted protein [Pelobates cultripes]|uniref:Fanconi anemia group B protein n=2 Tax=Pelobates cultripes TaxID=61616 RepID=A0AAD1QXM2_PELCU|nr:Hypothetical predicted protein [Pelobates cultripes]
MEEMMSFPEIHKRILCYNGEILTFEISQTLRASQTTKTSALLFSRKTFDPVSGTFIENFTGQHRFPASTSAIEFVCCECATDVRTSISIPCVLLKLKRQKQKRSSSKFTLLMLHSNNDMESCLNFRLDIGSVDDARLCDGPTVLLRHNETLHYISTLTAEPVIVPVNFIALHWVGTIEPGELVIFGVKNIDLENAPSPSIAGGTLKDTSYVLYSIENQKSIPGTCFLPDAYSSVICCLQVCTLQGSDGKFETSVIAASGKQLILFSNGVPEEVCQLPFENPFKLQVASTSRGDLLFIVSFSSGDACAIWKDSLKVAVTWQQVRDILVDDFLGAGFDQILLIFKDDPTKSPGPEDFKITDCCEINYPADTDTSKKDESAEDGCQENQFLTVQALEARLQAGLLFLQELQHDIQVKDRVIKTSCESLTNMTQGKDVIVQSAEKEGLTSLWDDSDNCPDSPSSDPCTSLAIPDCFVEKVWYRVIDDLLVVGVKLSNSVYSSLSNVGLSLIMDQEIASISPVTKCQTNVLKLPINASQVFANQKEPLAKKQRLDDFIKDSLPGDFLRRPCSPSYQNDLERTVTAVTELSPLLPLNNTSCVLLLHARRKNQPDCLLRSEKLIVPCGKISLSLEDILKGNYTVNLFEHCQVGCSLEDVFAVLSAFQKCSFHLLSPDYTLKSVQIWLIGQMQGEPVEHIPDIICSRKPGNNQGTLFIWNSKNPFEGTLTVFYRNDSTLLQCLHSLRRVLPPTCAINTTVLGGKDCLTESLAQSLEEELLALRSSVSSAESKVEKELSQRCKMKKNNGTTDSSSDTKERVQKYREELQIEQMQSDLDTPLAADGDLYSKSMLNAVQLQMNSDSLACRLANL